MTSLADSYRRVRDFTETLAAPLGVEDQVVQSMPDVSPTKWHRAHTTWFFETFVLANVSSYREYHPQYGVLFNSYYNAVGSQWPRTRRGVLSRPTVADVTAYRAHVDEAMLRYLEGGVGPKVAEIVTIGLHHEQQHQELLLTDIKHVLGQNPLFPIYREGRARPAVSAEATSEWIACAGGIVDVGHGGDAFAYDNEGPRHRALLASDYQLASRPVTNGEWSEFIDAGGYRQSQLWLSDGWALVNAEAWTSPLYWARLDDGWYHFTLGGLVPIDPHAPVTHISQYEADAFATWAGARIPTEFEWEAAVAALDLTPDQECNFVDDGHLTPIPGPGPQLFGNVWEWTSSAYLAYPGYQCADGALGEYNGKFMSGQMVLRGGSCATSRDHIRASYRNFFPASARWQFTGLRLAK